VARDLNIIVKGERLLKVTGSHAYVTCELCTARKVIISRKPRVHSRRRI